MIKQLKDKLTEVIDLATNSLWFPPILEEGFGENEQDYEGNYFKMNDGTYLRGTLVLYREEFFELTEGGHFSISKEFFLTENGDLLKFYTFTESISCDKCKIPHFQLHRIIAEDQSLEEIELDAIVNNISVDLNHAE